ncbi:hypothetical protein OGATHE_004693 [Ogataea polymorpha]|uniref:Uncharacterized protein n=1 Tax=Ogataea polymorpha TaxID=460523 RepID=A0A9P8P1H0_9ASCO|nr:hypothetical protein OGATHE_004693 [Ogataea polymorpha]
MKSGTFRLGFTARATDAEEASEKRPPAFPVLACSFRQPTASCVARLRIRGSTPDTSGRVTMMYLRRSSSFESWYNWFNSVPPLATRSSRSFNALYCSLNEPYFNFLRIALATSTGPGSKELRCKRMASSSSGRSISMHASSESKGDNSMVLFARVVTAVYEWLSRKPMRR